jgi:hypothetical protein
MQLDYARRNFWQHCHTEFASSDFHAGVSPSPRSRRQLATRYRRSLIPALTSQSDKSGHPRLMKLSVESRPVVAVLVPQIIR